MKPNFILGIASLFVLLCLFGPQMISAFGNNNEAVTLDTAFIVN